MSDASSTSAVKLQENLFALGNIRLRKMFGGHGIFVDDIMFALVDKAGTIFFKVDETITQLYEDAGSLKHNRMPYYQVPDQVLADEKILKEWAQKSITVAKNAK
jgi:DNA transformation protein and related proteins